jgi:hypothetical protein
MCARQPPGCLFFCARPAARPGAPPPRSWRAANPRTCQAPAATGAPATGTQCDPSHDISTCGAAKTSLTIEPRGKWNRSAAWFFSRAKKTPLVAGLSVACLCVEECLLVVIRSRAVSVVPFGLLFRTRAFLRLSRACASFPAYALLVITEQHSCQPPPPGSQRDIFGLQDAPSVTQRTFAPLPGAPYRPHAGVHTSQCQAALQPSVKIPDGFGRTTRRAQLAEPASTH